LKVLSNQLLEEYEDAIFPYQRELMIHALAADHGTPYYRNYFAAAPGSANDKEWASLTKAGLAQVIREPQPGIFPDRVYSVTFEGTCYVHHLMRGRKGHGRGSK
jgi:hypothetical protein